MLRKIFALSVALFTACSSQSGPDDRIDDGVNDHTGPQVLSYTPSGQFNRSLRDVYTFVFDEPLRLGSSPVHVSSWPVQSISAQVTLLPDEKTITIALTGLQPPVRIELRLAQVTDRWGNAASLSPYIFDYPAWVETTAPRYDDERSPTELTAAVDGSGAPVVAWTEAWGTCDPRLHARRFDGATWQDLGGALNLDAAKGATAPSLAARGDTMVLAWREGDCVHGDIHVAVLAGSAWSPLGGPVTSSPAAVAAPSVALDADGEAVVAWRAGDDELHVARWDGASWSRVGGSVSDGTLQVFSPSLALSAAGELCVAYTEARPANETGLAMHLRCWDGAAWQARGAAITAGGWYESGTRALVFDATGRPLVGYTDGSSVEVATLDGGTWTSAALAGGGTSAGAPALALDPARGLVAGWSSNNEVRAAVYGASGWTELTAAVTMLDSAWVMGSALAVGPDGGPWIAWIDHQGLEGSFVRVLAYNRE